MALNLTTASAALKDLYLPVIREQLNNKIMFLQQVERNSVDVEGQQAVLSLHVTRNSGVGARADGGTLPTAGNQGYVKETVGLKHVYGRIEVSGPTMRAMKSDRGSFTRAVESESKGIVTDLKRDVNRQLFGTSDGAISRTAVTTAANVVNLLNASQVTIRQIEVGSVIDIGTVASPTSIASGRTVTAVNLTTGALTIDGAPVTTNATTHNVFRAGSGGTGASQVEVTGLQTIVNNTGILHGVDPAVYPVWTSTVSSNAGTPRSATDTLFEAVLDEIDIASGEFPDLIVASHGVVRNYAAQLTSAKRFSNTTELHGGFTAAVIDTPDGSIPLAKERDVPAGWAFIVNTKHLKCHEQSDWDFMSEDGAVLSRVSSKDAYEATLYKDLELTTDRRNSHGVIKDLSES